MIYEGTENKVEWAGKTSIQSHPETGLATIVLMLENDKGTPVLAIAAGKIVPDNWVGKRVRVTVELLT
jgi:hypothetical protein